MLLELLLSLNRIAALLNHSEEVGVVSAYLKRLGIVEESIIGDINPEIVEALKAIKTRPGKVVSAYKRVATPMGGGVNVTEKGKDHLIKISDKLRAGKYKSPDNRAGAVILLNQHSVGSAPGHKGLIAQSSFTVKIRDSSRYKGVLKRT